MPFNDHYIIVVAIFALSFFLALTARRPARRCPRCHEVNREQAIFCAQCGSRLPER
jgi:rRNA maturation endonuclease Nob1